MHKVAALVLAVAIGGLAMLAPAPASADELLMFESDGCAWCELWNEEIAPIYPKTSEGKILPLRRIDVDEDLPPDLQHLGAVIYTPTFVVMEEGREVGRIIGYPGEDFFWPMLDEIVGRMKKKQARTF